MPLTSDTRDRNNVDEDGSSKPEENKPGAPNPDPKENPEAPRSRQGDGVASGEVPTGYYSDKDKE